MIRLSFLLLAFLSLSTASGDEQRPPVASFDFEDAESLETFWSLSDQAFPKLIPGPSPDHGHAISFAETEGCLVVPYSEEQFHLGDLSETSGITIAFWVKHAFEPRDHNFRILTAPGIDLSMMRGRIPLTSSIGGATGLHVDTNPHGINALDGQWHHIAITVDFRHSRDNGIIYVDGQAGATRDVSILRDFHQQNGKFIIGARNHHGVMGFRGALDELRFYDRTLNPHEVAHLVGGDLSAGVDQEVWLPEKAMLQGNSKLPATWSIEGKHSGHAAIGDPEQNTTVVEFTAPGAYRAVLTDKTGKTESVAITVHPPTAPIVNLTGDPDNQFEVGTRYPLRVSVSSPYDANHSRAKFQQLSGPADIEIVLDSQDSNSATISFPEPGLYGIAATSRIGNLEGKDQLQFVVNDSNPPRHYTSVLDPTYSVAFENAPSRSPLLKEGQSGNTGFRYFCERTPLPRTIPGARPFTGYAVDFTDSLGVGAIFNRHSNKDFGNLRTADGMAVAFWVKGTKPARNANILRAGGLLVTADSHGEHAKGLQVNTKNDRFTAVPADDEDWNLFDGEWHHCAVSINFTSSESNVSIHIDGIERGQGDYSYQDVYMDSMDATRTDHWHYLCGRKEADQTFNGALDDVVAFSRPIDAGVVEFLFHGPDQNLQRALSLPQVVVDAGANQQIPLPNAKAALDGKIRGATEGVTCQWSVLKGEGEVRFLDPSNLKTEVMLKHAPPSINPGYISYVFRLTATTREGLRTHDDVTLSFYTPIEKGIRQLSAVPAPGVHPRILFSPEDLPEIRQRCTELPIARLSLARIKELGDQRLSDLNTAQGVTYQSLLSGTPVDVIPALKGYGSDGYTNAKGDGGSLYNILYGRAFVALIEEEHEKLKEMGTVLSRLATAHLTTYQPDYPNKLTHDASGALGLAYDMLAQNMPEAERRPIRRLLSRMTRFRQADGTSNESQENSSNWKTFHDHIILASLAIEGEEGDDPRVFEDNIHKLRDFFTRYGVFPSGCAHEGWGYFNFGMGNGSLSILATARRDENFFATSNLGRSIDMAFRNLAIWEGGVRANGDTPGGIVSQLTALTQVAAWMYPQDPITQYLARSLAEGLAEGEKDARGLNLHCCLFGPDRAPSRPYEEVGKALPLDAFCKDSGYLTTRSSWTEDGTHLVFRCRMDKYFLGHQHPDVNSFELWSHKRHWFIDPGKAEIENDRHATVLIDGVGGGGSLNWWTWPSMPGRFLKYQESEERTYGLGDARTFYNYSVRPSQSPNGFVTDALKKRLGLNTEPFSDHGLKWKDFVYPDTDSDGLPSWRQASLSADFAYRSNPEMPVYRFNPVEKALRSAALYRAGPAFVVVTDDIQKDHQKHDYTWVANMPVDAIEVIESTNDTLILKHRKDPAESGARLYVKLLGAEGKTRVSLENFVIQSSQSPVTRLRVDANDTTNPRFQVLLYPYRHGDPLPDIKFTDSEFQIKIGDREAISIARGIGS